MAVPVQNQTRSRCYITEKSWIMTAASKLRWLERRSLMRWVSNRMVAGPRFATRRELRSLGKALTFNYGMLSKVGPAVPFYCLI